MKKLTAREIEKLGALVGRAVEHGQLQVQCDGKSYKAGDGKTYPQCFTTADLGEVAMDVNDEANACAITVSLPIRSLKWLWVRVNGSKGGQAKASRVGGNAADVMAASEQPTLHDK